MRRASEILKLPIGELTDEEICKAALHRLNTKMCALVYRGDDGKIYYVTRWKDKVGRFYWSKISTGIHLLFDRVHTKIFTQIKL